MLMLVIRPIRFLPHLSAFFMLRTRQYNAAMDQTDARPREVIHAGCRFQWASTVGNDRWQTDWRCIGQGCRAHDFAVGDDREQAENGASLQMQEHARKAHKPG